MTARPPPQSLVRAFPQFFGWVVPRFRFLADRHNATPTSWFRTVGENDAVGGAARSQHLLGWAADFSVPRSARAQFIADTRAMGMVPVDEGDHVHVQMYPARVVPERFFPVSNVRRIPV